MLNSQLTLSQYLPIVLREMSTTTPQSFFSISFEYVLCGTPLPYDLFVNSSTIKDRVRYVRIFPEGDSLNREDLDQFRRKYQRLYVPEDQRSKYLDSLVHSGNFNDAEKTAAIKDSAIHYLDSIFDNEKEFTTEVLVTAVKGCRDSVESMVDVIQEYKIDDLRDLIANLSFHDFYTYDHSINVSMYNILIFKAVAPKAPKEMSIQAGLGGMLHDLGKLKIPTEIINHPGKLTDQQFAMIKKHPRFGVELLRGCGLKENDGVDLEALSRVINEHHENFNGSGYPSKIAGKDIHLLARITAISDFFDAITTKRSYHEVLSTEDAIQLMSQSKGKKLDPDLFDIFTQHINTFVYSAKAKQQVPEDYDPCQPHLEIPLEEVKFEPGQQNFGKIKLVGPEDKNDSKNYGDITIADKKRDAS